MTRTRFDRSGGFPPGHAGRFGDGGRTRWLLGAAAAFVAVVGFAPLPAGDITIDFGTDPNAYLSFGGNLPEHWVRSGGNPGGFLALTWPIASQKTTVVFPNLDPGKIVTGFTFTCDLRVGNGQGDFPADGFSLSFARENDALLLDANSDQFGGNCCAETGTKTGLVVSFDTRAGNIFPDDPNDTSDVEGVIVRVDNVTVRKVALATQDGTCTDVTSLETGPRNAAYWANGGNPTNPAAWAQLCWQPFKVDLTPDGKLTVEWKGHKVLDKFQTTFFPTAGAFVLAGRTGDLGEIIHVDNIHLVTRAETVTAVPEAPGNFKAAEVGARRVLLKWNAAVVSGDPAARVAYQVLRDGLVIAPLVTALGYEDRGLHPGWPYTYTVLGQNIAGNVGPDSTLVVKTATEAPGVAFLKAEQWIGIDGTSVDAGVSDPHASDPPDHVRYVNGFSFGETSGFGDTWGDNYLVKISGVFTAPKSGNFRFFLRSDDNGELFLNEVGPGIPDGMFGTPIAIEDACCAPFLEPDNIRTSRIIPLTAGKSYGMAFYVKEGVVGDWGQVAIREEGDPAVAGALTPLRGSVLAGPVDSVGARIVLTTQPAPLHVRANEPAVFSVVASGSSPYGADSGNAIAYQWYVDGTAVLGANAPAFALPIASYSDNGKKFKVVAAVAGASVASDEVTLTVDPDTIPPTVVSIVGSDRFDSATVTFSEAVTSPTAIDRARYQMAGLTVISATRIDARTIRLATSRQAVGATYPATVKGVKDTAGLDSAFTGTLRTFVRRKGISVFGSWQGQTGGFETWVSAGLADTAPTLSRVVTDWSGNDGDEGDNYFGRTVGLFTPARTGNYIFFLATDDHGELYLSTDSTPANKRLIAQEPVWGGRRYYVDDGTGANNSGTRGAPGALANRSDQFPATEWPGGHTIRLVAGTPYYLELLYKEGDGGDHGSATFVLQGGGNPANDGSALRGDLISWYVPPPPPVPNVSSTIRNPDGRITVSFEGGTFQVSLDLKNWKDVPGVTSPYTFTPTSANLFARVRE